MVFAGSASAHKYGQPATHMPAFNIVGVPTVQSGGVVWEHEVECMQEYNSTAVLILMLLAGTGLLTVICLLLSSRARPESGLIYAKPMDSSN